MAVYAAGNAYTALLLKNVIDSLLGAGKVTAVMTVGGRILLAYFLKGVGGYVSSILMADVGQRVVRDLRDRLYRHILGQSAAFFSRRTSGQLISLLTNDVNQ